MVGCSIALRSHFASICHPKSKAYPLENMTLIKEENRESKDIELNLIIGQTVSRLSRHHKLGISMTSSF